MQERSGCCSGANDALRNLRGKGKGKNIPAFIFIPTNPPFLPVFFTPPSLLFLSWFGKLGFWWSILGFAKFLPDLKFFPYFSPCVVSLLDSCSFPKLQWQLWGVGGDGWIWESRGGAAGAPFIPLVNHGNVALERWIGVRPGSSFPGFIGQGAEGAPAV